MPPVQRVWRRRRRAGDVCLGKRERMAVKTGGRGRVWGSEVKLTLEPHYAASPLAEVGVTTHRPACKHEIHFHFMGRSGKPSRVQRSRLNATQLLTWCKALSGEGRERGAWTGEVVKRGNVGPPHDASWRQVKIRRGSPIWQEPQV